MNVSTITSKGQTTIPIDIQKQLNVKPGDKIQYFIEADGKVSLLPKPLSISDVAGILPKPKKAKTLEEMDEGIAQAAIERNKL